MTLAPGTNIKQRIFRVGSLKGMRAEDESANPGGACRQNDLGRLRTRSSAKIRAPMEGVRTFSSVPARRIRPRFRSPNHGPPSCPWFWTGDMIRSSLPSRTDAVSP